MPEPDTSTVVRAYQHGLALAREAEYFEAHEAFETAWRTCDTSERDFFQGLVHVVVSAYQRGRGKPVAAERQRVKALRRLGPFAPEHRGLDVSGLLGGLQRAEADLRQHLVERNLHPPIAIEEQQEPERDEGGA
jgi:predicted metal-dependent hydrolase